MIRRTHTLLLATLIALGGLAPMVQAQQKFSPNVVISSQTGKWTQAVKEKELRQIDCWVQRVSGGDDTFINFRIGNDGKTFPGGKRYPVTKSEKTKIVVPAAGIVPNGKPLVINAYNGSVKITQVHVHYKK